MFRLSIGGRMTHAIDPTMRRDKITLWTKGTITPVMGRGKGEGL